MIFSNQINPFLFLWYNQCIYLTSMILYNNTFAERLFTISLFLQCHLSMTFLINYDFSHVYTQHQWFDIQTLFQKGDLLFPFSCNAIYPWLCFNPLYVFTYSPFHLTNLEKSFLNALINIWFFYHAYYCLSQDIFKCKILFI